MDLVPLQTTVILVAAVGTFVLVAATYVLFLVLGRRENERRPEDRRFPDGDTDVRISLPDPISVVVADSRKGMKIETEERAAGDEPSLTGPARKRLQESQTVAFRTQPSVGDRSPGKELPEDKKLPSTAESEMAGSEMAETVTDESEMAGTDTVEEVRTSRFWEYTDRGFVPVATDLTDSDQDEDADSDSGGEEAAWL